jgi:hypothetical protein
VNSLRREWSSVEVLFGQCQVLKNWHNLGEENIVGKRILGNRPRPPLLNHRTCMSQLAEQ